MNAKRRVAKLLEEKRKIDQSIESIQSKCKHHNKVIKQVNDNSYGHGIRQVCNDCQKVTGYPNPIELADYLKH